MFKPWNFDWVPVGQVPVWLVPVRRIRVGLCSRLQLCLFNGDHNLASLVVVIYVSMWFCRSASVCVVCLEKRTSSHLRLCFWLVFTYGWNIVILKFLLVLHDLSRVDESDVFRAFHSGSISVRIVCPFDTTSPQSFSHLKILEKRDREREKEKRKSKWKGAHTFISMMWAFEHTKPWSRPSHTCLTVQSG